MTQGKLEETQADTEPQDAHIDLPKKSKIHFSGEPDFNQDGPESSQEQSTSSAKTVATGSASQLADSTKYATIGDAGASGNLSNTQSVGSSSSSTFQNINSQNSSQSNQISSTSSSSFEANQNTNNDTSNAGDNLIEDICDFQAAWQTLDVARIIQSKDKSREGQLKLAETLIFLGDVSMESENFDQASQDYGESLTIKLDHFGRLDKKIAEVRFKLALAYEYGGKKQDAINEIELVKENLILQISNTDEASVKKISELKELLTDVNEKIDELKASIGSSLPINISSLPVENSAEISEKAKKIISEALLSGKVNDLTTTVRSKKIKSDQKDSDNASASSNPNSNQLNVNDIKITEKGDSSSDILNTKRKIVEGAGTSVDSLPNNQHDLNNIQSDKKPRNE
ncbi:hypothetical protein BB561_000065 [Smittium simulii]|uniref:Tetratricopeptide SHNi-TPR domain-containing protein n=1 Tax=Smittium simulii TaxID=133385 RepID=A0A2T9Z0V7_9FUNG|nr:hypothetical protein BB561_000065 [Smittium simulii]